jgi:hypothetical protein
MTEKKKRLQYYRERAPQLIRLAQEAYDRIKTRYLINLNLYESIPRRRALAAFCLYFLELQITHIKALLLLEREKNLDVLLVVRSMVEGTAQMLHVHKSEDPKALAVLWWNFLHHKESGYWYGKGGKVKGAKAIVKTLEEHLDEKIWSSGEKSSLLEFWAHFSAYHHWNRTNRMKQHKDDLPPFLVPFKMLVSQFLV